MDTHVKQPLVSITMITYNRAHFIAEAIESVRAQTYENWELIIIDDASRDDTESIVGMYSDSRIHYTKHHQNKGIYPSRREAVQQSKGNYIAILDSDDVWSETGKLSKQVEYMGNNPDIGVVGTYITLIDEESHSIGEDRYKTEDTDIRKHILARNQFAHSSTLIRRRAYDDVGGYRNLNLAEDLDLFLRIGRAWKLANLPFHGTAYRIHTHSETSEKRTVMAKRIIALIQKHKDAYPWKYALTKAYVRLALSYMR